MTVSVECTTSSRKPHYECLNNIQPLIHYLLKWMIPVGNIVESGIHSNYSLLVAATNIILESENNPSILFTQYSMYFEKFFTQTEVYG